MRIPAHLAQTLMSIAFVGVIGVFLLWKGGAWILNELVYENSMFEIQRIQIGTDGMIAKEHYRTWTGIRDGDNVFKLDLARVKRDLESIPWVQGASVRRVLPDTVAIEVAERKPIATLPITEADTERGGFIEIMCQVDSEGFISKIPREYLDREARNIDYQRLPRILPYVDTVLREGRLSNAKQIKEALKLLNEFNKSNVSERVRIATIDLSEEGYLRVITSSHQKVLFGQTMLYRKQIARWGAVIEMAIANNKEIRELDLSVGNRHPLKWEDAEMSLRQPATGFGRRGNG